MTQFLSWEKLRQLKMPSGKDFLRGFGYTFMGGLVTLGLIILAAVIDVVYFNDPPVTIKNLDAPYTAALCPGQVIEVHKSVEVGAPLQLFSYFDVMDLESSEHISGTQVSNGPRPYPKAGLYKDTYMWLVPDLPPGKYIRVFTVRGTDGRENSIFTMRLFEIEDKSKCHLN